MGEVGRPFLAAGPFTAPLTVGEMKRENLETQSKAREAKLMTAGFGLRGRLDTGSVDGCGKGGERYRGGKVEPAGPTPQHGQK